jgi:transcriptional regulator with XRE-family HTH domain
MAVPVMKTDEQRARILELQAAGLSQTEVAEELGVSRARIRQVLATQPFKADVPPLGDVHTRLQALMATWFVVAESNLAGVLAAPTSPRVKSKVVAAAISTDKVLEINKLHADAEDLSVVGRWLNAMISGQPAMPEPLPDLNLRASDDGAD